MTFTVVENVRGFFGSRPPLVVFMIFLGSVAVGLITFAYIVKVKDMPDSDVSEDWNMFLERVSGLKYCVVSEPGWAATNSSQGMAFKEVVSYREQLTQVAGRVVRDVHGVQHGSSSSTTSTTPSTPSSNNLMNVSVVMDLELYPALGLRHLATWNSTSYITSTLHGSQLGRSGHRRYMEVNLTLSLPAMGNGTLHCKQGRCYRGSVCVTLTAPRAFFPHTLRPGAEDMCMKDLDQGGENHFHLEVIPNHLRCFNASHLSLQHRYDPTLSAVTAMQDRSAINLHLMHSSYFLFVMVVTLFCYAVIKGRPAKVKIVYTQCASEKHAPNQV